MQRIKQIEEILKIQFPPLATVHVHWYHCQKRIHLPHTKTQYIDDRTDHYNLKILFSAEIKLIPTAGFDLTVCCISATHQLHIM